MLRCKLRYFVRLLPPSCATNFHVAKSKSDVYLLQHKNLLRKKVVIRTTNHLNLQRNIVARRVARKMLSVLLGLNLLKAREKSLVQIAISFGFPSHCSLVDKMARPLSVAIAIRVISFGQSFENFPIMRTWKRTIASLSIAVESKSCHTRAGVTSIRVWTVLTAWRLAGRTFVNVL